VLTGPKTIFHDSWREYHRQPTPDYRRQGLKTPPNRLLKNPLAAPCGVGKGLKILIYSPSTLRFFAHFRLAWHPPETFSTTC
jgi:hypothetical protein